MGHVVLGMIHLVEPPLVEGGRTHLSASFEGAFELERYSRVAVMQPNAASEGRSLYLIVPSTSFNPHFITGST